MRSGVYTVNEARDILGLDPVAGGDDARVYGTAGAIPLAAPAKQAARTPLTKDGFDPDEPRVPPGNPDGGQWTDEGDAETANDRNERKTKCIEECSHLLERPLPYRWSNLNTFDSYRCVNECMQAAG